MTPREFIDALTAVATAHALGHDCRECRAVRSSVETAYRNAYYQGVSDAQHALLDGLTDNGKQALAALQPEV